jgi:hypothetical protein
LSAIAKKPSRLHDLGVLDNQERQYLLQLKEIFDDEQITIASEEKERAPFAVSHRVIQK